MCLRDDGLDVDLFHARFAMADRPAIEAQVLARFGKDSTPEDRRGRVRGCHGVEARRATHAAQARAGWGRFEADVLLLPLEREGDDLWRRVLMGDAAERRTLRYATTTGLSLRGAPCAHPRP